MKNIHIAIDGPAGSGKSTISKLIASKLKMTHIDTGAMYRAVTLYAIENSLDLQDELAYKFLEEIKITYVDDKIYLNGKDVSKEIRTNIVTKNVSLVSSFAYVREKMVDLQRDAAVGLNVVMDGRDIGTVVLPNATIKVFLTANVLERAKRRLLENNDHKTSLEQVIEDIELRDKKDSTREESPLKKANDAIELDTTYLTIEEVVEKIILMIEKKENE